MANSKQRRADRRQAAAPAESGKAWMAGDSFQNFEARVGLGTGNQAGGTYGFDHVSRNRTVLEAAYQSNWLCRAAVDVVAEDMTREGIEITSDLEPDQIEELQESMDNLGAWDALCDTIKWSRLYGGALAVILIDGQTLGTPLRPETVSRDSFKGLLVLDRWLVQPSQALVRQYGEHFGQPEYYDVVADGLVLTRQRIHHTRCIRLDGDELPYWRKAAENGWGISVLEKLWDRLTAFDSTTMGAAQLVYKAHLRTYKVKGLRNLIAAGGPAMEALVKQMEMVRKYQSFEGLTLMDSEDEFEAHAYSFSGLSDLMLQFGQQISGALQIPLVRLFGQSPAGLNSTGESDLKTYHDNIKRQQERRLRSGVLRLLDIVSRSVRGKELPKGTTIKFVSLHQLSAEQKATVTQAVTSAVVQAEESGLVPRKVALQELKAHSQVTGVWSNITDEDITEAENDPPPGSELLDPEDPANADPTARKGRRPPPEEGSAAAAAR